MSLTTRKWPVNAYALKWVAIVTMLIDHTGVSCYEWLGWGGPYLLMRRIGRVAFPIFAFLFAEGFRYTRNRWAYLRNLLIFAVLSEIPFDLLNGWGNRYSSQNIFWTLSLGLFGLIVAEAMTGQCEKWGIPRPVTLLCAALPIAVTLCAGEVAGVDYGYWGVLLIVMIYSAETAASFLICDELPPQMARNLGAALAALLWMALYDIAHGWLNELYGIPALLLFPLYNGERGRYRLPKWFFYGFYPGHLLILYALHGTVFKWLLTG